MSKIKFIFLSFVFLIGAVSGEVPAKLDVLLFVALPAAGKSEVRRYLSSLPVEKRIMEYKIADTVAIDDFPYVFFMRRVSDELTKRGEEGAFFISPVLPFKNPNEWKTLIALINEDYEDMVNVRITKYENPSLVLFNRLDNAREKMNLKPIFSRMGKKLVAELAIALEKDAKKILDDNNNEISRWDPSKTVVIEFSRGGAAGSTMPLPAPFGYQQAFSCMSDAILQKASILNIWVSPEESRKNNELRADPNNPGSIMGHSVPIAVMYADYGCDDIDYLLKISSRTNNIEVQKGEKTYFLPVARYDNRVNKTNFLRGDLASWPKEKVAVLDKTLKEGFSSFK